MAFVPARETARRRFLERLSTARQTRICHEVVVDVEGSSPFAVFIRVEDPSGNNCQLCSLSFRFATMICSRTC